MGKLLKVSVILLVVLSLVSLVLAAMLSARRSTILARDQALQDGMAQVSKAMKMEAVAAENFKDPNFTTKQAAVMDAFVNNQFDSLANLQKDRDTVKSTLDKTTTDLQAARDESSKLNSQIAKLEEEKKSLEAKPAELEAKIAPLEQEKELLTAKVAGLENQVVKAEEEKASLADERGALDRALKDCEGELRRVTAGASGVAVVPKGTKGVIVKVNPEWSFVVLNIGKKQGLVPDAVMLVNRGDKLLGRVRISLVKDDCSIADVMPEWTKGSIQEGDHVLF